MTAGTVFLSWLVGLLFAIVPVGQSFDQRLSDFVWRLSHDLSADSRFVFVDIDERSLAEIGSWPWPRVQIAELVSALQDKGASEITIDAIFPDDRAGDAELAAVLSQEPSPVGAITFALPGNETVQTGALPKAIGSDLCQRGIFPQAIGFLGNTPALQLSAGHITPRVDPDGVVRAMPAFICYEGDAYPALALASFLEATGLVDEPLRLESGSWFDSIMTMHVGDVLQVPLTLDGHLVVPFDGQASQFSRVSASDVLAGSTLPVGRWVVIGSSAVGLSDRVVTPLAPLEAGALIHMRLLRGLLDERLPSQVPIASASLWLVALLISTLLGTAASMGALRWWAAPLAVVGLVAITIFASVWLRASALIILPLAGPIGAVVTAGIGATTIAFIQYRVERSELIQRLQAYLPVEVAARIADGQTVGSVDMSRRSAVLLTVDLRNFDRWAERLEAKLSAAVLHHYVCSVSDRIQQHGGTVLQVSGCRVRAVWDLSHSPRDIMNLLQTLLIEVDGSFPDVELDPELPPMGLAIGVEQGDLLMGTYGSESSRGFSLLGDVALLVQGLVRMTSELSAPCLVGPVFASRLDGAAKVSLGTFLLEESSVPRELFEPVFENYS